MADISNLIGNEMTATIARPEEPRSQGGTVEVTVIDTDVHVEPRSFEQIVSYMSPPWRDRAISDRVPFRRPTFATLEGGGRGDSIPDDGSFLGSDPEMAGRQLFVDDPMDYAILLPWSFRGFTVDPLLDTALSAAANDWAADTWLSKYNTENRYIGSITVSVEDPVGAAREIERWAGDPRFKQVAITHYGPRPFGHPMYAPIWEAAARHNLPVAIHFRGGATQPLGWTPTGTLQYFVEYHSLIAPLAYAAHMVSFICNGVFDRHPNLKVLFIEGGFLWHQPVLDRLERHWKRTSHELAAKKTPREYIRDHFRFATQPIEESITHPDRIATLFEQANAAKLLMFSSDWPHYDFDPPSKALPRSLEPEIRKRILCENAREIYNLPKTRPADRFDLEAGRK